MQEYDAPTEVKRRKLGDAALAAQERRRMKQETNRQQHRSFRQSVLNGPGEGLPRERSTMQYAMPREIPQSFT